MTSQALKPTDFVEFHDNHTNQWLRGIIVDINKTVLDTILDSSLYKDHATVLVLLEDGDLTNVTWHRYSTCGQGDMCVAQDIKILQRMS